MFKALFIIQTLHKRGYHYTSKNLTIYILYGSIDEGIIVYNGFNCSWFYLIHNGINFGSMISKKELIRKEGIEVLVYACMKNLNCYLLIPREYMDQNFRF